MGAELRDLIYFDFNKAASLFSQAKGGLLKEIQESTESSHGKRAFGGIAAPFVKAEAGGDAQEKTSILESRVLHHDLLTRLEDWLNSEGQLLDLNVFSKQHDNGPLDFSNEGIRNAISSPSFLVVEGWAEFQDYERFND
ncbi:MAG TPA: hypothetical protein VFW96_07080, partial [Thermomicrobiales bacterium]|nr:hypothetical protein [Thermomicrobiales bacterium]